MATVLQLLLDGQTTAESLVTWLKNKNDNAEVHGGLENTEGLRSEFIAYFLNFLRDQTLHLLQNAKSSNPSPVKTPSTNKAETPAQKRSTSSSKRVQLFAASPGDCRRQDFDSVSPLFSPNSSIDSSHLHHRLGGSDKTNRNDYHRKRWDNETPNRRRSSLSHTPEAHRSKQKLSLGEFILTPDSGGPKKRGSPYSSREASPSPTAPSTNRRNHGKKKGGSPLIRHQEDVVKESNSPVFSLISMNDFPPMGGEEKREKSQNKCVNDGPSAGSRPRRIALTPVSKSSVENELSPFSQSKSSISDVLHSNSEVEDDSKTKQINKEGAKIKIEVNGRSSQKQKPRRINPTPVTKTTNTGLSSPFNQVPETELPPPVGASGDAGADNCTLTAIAEERKLLRQEKVRRQQLMMNDPCASPKSSNTEPCVTPTKAVLERKASTVEYINADLKLVTCKHALDVMSDLYSRALAEHLFPNLTVELYFLTQLLTSVGGEGKENTDINPDGEEVRYFSTVHNAVYFAVCILEKVVRVLSHLDKSTLRFLSDNTRIADFSPELQKRLKEAYEKSGTGKSCLSFPRSPIGGVSFQADTDNRKNFPNDKCFHQFKKQRDVFYEIIRDWEDKHQNTGWSLVDAQGERIRWLVTFRTDLANHLHFARLFLSQLIVMCKGDKSVKSEEDEETVTLLAQLKKTNPEKFKKLQERFIRPFSLGGPCPSPSFTGYQEFFRDFIIAAGNAVFNQHLTNTLVAKVTELNSTEFGAASGNNVKSTSTETEEEEDQRDMFSSCLITLRLLGKFLGFVAFLPYQTMEPLPDSFQASYIAQRNQLPPPLDVVQVVSAAVQCHRLVLTVPWLVEFASQMDPVAPTLDAYECFLSYLRLALKICWGKVSKEHCFYGNLMVVILITWLFDAAPMPDGLFFKEFDAEQKITSLLDECNSLSPLDDLDLVNQDLLYTCCPYVAEMRNLLMEFAMGTNSRGAVRKITPTTTNTGATTTVTQQQLQSQLVDNFFHNHPASLRRTVEFVGERTFSNFIKKFRSSILPKELMAAKSKVKCLKETLRSQEPEKRKMGQESEEILKLVPQVLADLKLLVKERQREFCHTKTLAVLKLLLPEEQPDSVVAVAANIASELGETRVMQWVNSHVTSAVIQTELTGSTERILSTHLLMGDHSGQFQPVSQPDFTSHQENARGLSDIICDLKEMTASLVLKSNFRQDRCLMLLHEAQTAVEERQDLVPLVVKSLAQLVLHLAVTVIIEQPGPISDAVADKCLSMWKKQLGKETEFEGLCCIRVIHGLQRCQNPQLALGCFCKLVIVMLEENIIDPGVFQEGCHKVIKLAKSYNVDLQPLGQLVCDIVQHFNQSESIPSLFCKTLEKIFHLSAEGSYIARLILPLLDKYAPLEIQSESMAQDTNSTETVLNLNIKTDEENIVTQNSDAINSSPDSGNKENRVSSLDNHRNKMLINDEKQISISKTISGEENKTET